MEGKKGRETEMEGERGEKGKGKKGKEKVRKMEGERGALSLFVTISLKPERGKLKINRQ